MSYWGLRRLKIYLRTTIVMCDFADLSYFDLFIYDYKFKDNCRE